MSSGANLANYIHRRTVPLWLVVVSCCAVGYHLRDGALG
jgi:hypothetical protein